MNFKEWFYLNEADPPALRLSPASKRYLDVKNDFTIKKTIENFRVYFVDSISMENLEAAQEKEKSGFLSRMYQQYVATPLQNLYRNWKFRFDKSVERDSTIFEHTLGKIRELGLEYRVNVPIVVYYQWKEATTTTLGRFYPAGEREGTPVQSHIQIWRREDEDMQQFAKTIAHEVGHAIYMGLNNVQKMHIYNLARQFPSPTKYGSPEYKKGREHHKSGSEWFSEMLANVILGAPTGAYEDPGIFKRILRKIGISKEPEYSPELMRGMRGMIRSVKRPPIFGQKLYPTVLRREI